MKKTFIIAAVDDETGEPLLNDPVDLDEISLRILVRWLDERGWDDLPDAIRAKLLGEAA